MQRRIGSEHPRLSDRTGEERTRAERASRSWSAMDDDGTGRERNERNRDALSTTELTPAKSKRQVTAGDDP